MKPSNSFFTENSLLYNILLQMQCLVDALDEHAPSIFLTHGRQTLLMALRMLMSPQKSFNLLAKSLESGESST